MPVTELRVSGYRSLRDVTLPLGQINVLVGPNGCGKSNLYQAMYLLSAAAQGQLAQTLAEEGGMPSVLWAGPRKQTGPARMQMGVTIGSVVYDLASGLPKPTSGAERDSPTLFDRDPEVKEETVFVVEGRKKTALLERGSATAWVRDDGGRRVLYPLEILESESILAQIREPHLFPHLASLRQQIGDWRFYHHFRTDADSPLRHPQVGVRTPVLRRDGRDLAAALRTIMEIGDYVSLRESVDQAFPGASLCVDTSEDHRFRVSLQMPGIRRPFEAREMSDGTLHYLCLLAALLSPRLPGILALNEPETSLHSDLLEPLALLIVRAACYAQLWITTHSEALAQAITRHSGTAPIRLEKVRGETRITA